ncbi:MAG: methyltransferase domain-containing protein [Ornithinimicrobium sp.]
MTTLEMNETTHPGEASQTADTEAFAERLFSSMLGTLDVMAIALADQLGLYESLNGVELTSTELAEHTGINERYAREWLEQQSATGVLEVDDPTLPASDRRFHLSAAHAEVLVDQNSLAYLTPFARLIASSAVQLPQLLDAYRTGGGVSWADYGETMRTGQADANRALFLHSLASEWIPQIEGAAAALERGGQVLDVGCGEGWSSIAVALGFPNSRVIGVDQDLESVLAAREHAEAMGVGDRVSFHCGDAAEFTGRDFDLVCAFECVHDMADPTPVLAAMRRAASPEAPIVVMDERVGEQFVGRADEVEQLMYGLSLMICLPDGLSHTPSVGTGTVMRPDTLRGYAQAAGFGDIEILDIENDLFRFYRLTA